MTQWTDRPASSGTDFPKPDTPHVRGVELSSRGPDGQRLVVTVRRVTAFDLMTRPQGVEAEEAMRYLAERSVVSPALFNGSDGPQWADLSLVDQMALITAIAEMNMSTEAPEVAEVADAFPGGDAAGDVPGSPGNGSSGDRADAPSVAASSVAGEDAGAGSGS